MSTLKPTKKISRRHELREDTVVTFYSKVLKFIEQNKPIVYGILGAVVIFLAALVSMNYLQSQKQDRAISEMAPAVSLFEEGDYLGALDGTDSVIGLVAIVDDFGGTKAGNLARFYAADALFRLGRYDEALEYFGDFEGDSDYIGASALAGEGAIYENRGDFERAGDLYRRAAEVYESNVTAPGYLLDAGRAYHKAGETNKALRVFETIKQTYGDTPEAQRVDVLIARTNAGQGA